MSEISTNLHPTIQAPVLIVDDNPNNLKVLAQQIKGAGWKVAIAKNGRTAIDLAQQNPPTLILLDVIMPELDGFETCKQLKSLPETKDIPVIFMTALNDTNNKVKGLSIGGVDYITKPFQVEEVLARISLHCQLSSLNQKLEQQNQFLEEKVDQRTAELVATLDSLQYAQKRLERSFEEVKHAKELAESANLAKSQFLANMSHEFRTPLTAIIGFADFLTLSEPDLSTQSLQSLQAIIDAGEKLLKMVCDILTLSEATENRLELNLETFDLEELLREIEDSSQTQLRKNNNQLDIKIQDVGTIHSDREKVKQSVELILENACKFTKSGHIKVNAFWQNELKQSGQPVLFIEIEDTGIGISPEQISNIFLPFSQGDNSSTRHYEGAGLGLSLAKELVQILEGEVTVRSELGIGSVFSIILPLATKESTIDAA